MKRLTALLAAMSFSAGLHAAPILAPAWQSEDVLAGPESVIYHASSDSLFVSNVNGQPTEANGQGFISRLHADGRIAELHWIEGLDAPKGLALRDDRLYVADIDKLVVIDIQSGRILQRHLAEGARFLNDVAVDAAGQVYVSDMMTHTIYRLVDDRLENWLHDPALESPNGLLVEGNRLIVASWGIMHDGFATEVPGHLKQVDLASKRISSLGDGRPAGNLDGLESDGQGNYLVTDWLDGALLHIRPDGTRHTLIRFPQGSADHTVLHAQGLVIVPLMLDNRLLAFRMH